MSIVRVLVVWVECGKCYFDYFVLDILVVVCLLFGVLVYLVLCFGVCLLDCVILCYFDEFCWILYFGTLICLF